MAQATDTPEKSTTDKARDTARDATNEAKSTASEWYSTARDKAGEMAQDARDSAEAYGEAQKNHYADETSKIAGALRNASQELAEGSPQERIFAQLANGVADFADTMKQKSVSEMGHDVNEVARRNPAAFLGGAALLGFATARFLKASARHDSDDEFDRPAPYNPSAPAVTPAGTDIPS